MYVLKPVSAIASIFLSVLALGNPMMAQSVTYTSGTASEAAAPKASAVNKSGDKEKDAAEALRESRMKYRRLQSNGLLVETAYHQDGDDMQHTFMMRRDGEHYWASEFRSEIPLGSSRHQLTFSLPIQSLSKEGSPRGAGDAEVEYSYTAIGSNSSRVTVSPSAGVSLPIGNWRRELGAGAPGVKASVPVSYVFTKNLAATTNAGISYFHRARNGAGERANLVNYELGQGIAWYAKPNLNFLLEAKWERSQKVTGQKLKEREDEVFVSPGIRWAHRFRNGAAFIPGFAVPIGAGPSKGNNGVLFYLAFEHRFRNSEEEE